MARSRGKRGLKGLVGTPMGGPSVRRRTGPLQRNDKLCPVCYSVAGQPCRQVLSPPGATTLRLGKPMPTMHRARTGQQGSQPPEQAERRRTSTRRRTTAAAAQEPVPIEQVHPDRAGFVPRNRRGGDAVTGGWSRNNSDAIPRASRS